MAVAFLYVLGMMGVPADDNIRFFMPGVHQSRVPYFNRIVDKYLGISYFGPIPDIAFSN